MRWPLFTISFFLGSLSLAGAAPHFFYDDIEHEYDVPYTAPPGQPSRLAMLKEMGEKYPNFNCEQDCSSADPVVREACTLGSFGSLYVLTTRQMTTNRTGKYIWKVPNASLNIEPYAYMKEMEAGIPCEQSGYIKKFPTREVSPGGQEPVVSRVEVCRVWQLYFKSAGAPPVKGTSKPPEQISYTQSLLWRGHTTSLAHNYWQYYLEYTGDARGEVPKDEYKMWMGWNRVVGKIVPALNERSCGSDALFTMKQIMPDCIRGAELPGGKKCRGESPPGLGNMINRWGLAIVQNSLSTLDFGRGLSAMESPVMKAMSSPYANVITPCVP
ncbi:MAG: hypothetical protein ACXVCI_18885 [Bdellovibrionota bacterium]